MGSGKSSLINALLGQMQRISGKIGINESDLHSGIAIITQEPWIQNATVMENILFGKPFDADRYHSVLDACALIDDLKVYYIKQRWPKVFNSGGIRGING